MQIHLLFFEKIDFGLITRYRNTLRYSYLRHNHYFCNFALVFHLLEKVNLWISTT